MSVPASELETKQSAEDSLTSDVFNWETCPAKLFEIFKAATNPEQEILNLEQQGITDDEVLSYIAPFLYAYTHINTLNIGGNPLSSISAEALATNDTLTTLNIGAVVQLGPPCDANLIGDAIAIALATNNTLITLHLVLSHISDHGAMALAKNTTLTTLHINNNNICDKGAKAFARNTTLTTLHMDYNNICDEGAKAFARNTTLTTLHIAKNNIGDMGAIALASNRTLTTLFAWQNSIGNAGAKALARNTTLSNLNLFMNNNIGDIGAVFLANNETLRTLNVRCCSNIGPQGADALLQCQHYRIQKFLMRQRTFQNGTQDPNSSVQILGGTFKLGVLPTIFKFIAAIPLKLELYLPSKIIPSYENNSSSLFFLPSSIALRAFNPNVKTVSFPPSAFALCGSTFPSLFSVGCTQRQITQSISPSRPMTFAFPLSTFPPSSFCTSIAQNVATHASDAESEDPDVQFLWSFSSCRTSPPSTQRPITQPAPAPRAPKRKAEAITVISDTDSSDEDVPSSTNNAEPTEQEDTAEQRRQRVRDSWALKFPSSKR